MQEVRRAANSAMQGRRGDWLIAAGLALLGLLLRLPYMATIPVYDDEVVEAVYALAIRPGGFMPLVNIDTYNGPLFSYLLAAGLAVFPSPLVPRAMVMIMGALTVGATYWLARASGLGRAWAAMASLLMAVNPIHILVNSHLASTSYIIPLFSTAFLAALVTAVQQGSGGWLIAAGALLGLSGQVHPAIALILPGVAAWFLLRKPVRIGLNTRWPYLAALVFLAIYSPILIFNLQSSLAGVQEVALKRGYAWGPVSSVDMYLSNLGRLLLQLGRQVSGVLRGDQTFRDLIGLPLIVCVWAAGGLVVAARKGNGLPAWAVASQVLIMPAFSSYYGMILEPRYTAQLTPLMLVAMVIAVTPFSLIGRRESLPKATRDEDSTSPPWPSPYKGEGNQVWGVYVIFAALSLWQIASLAEFYKHQIAIGRTAEPNYAFVDEVLRRRQGEPILICDGLGRFNPTEYIFATRGVPYIVGPLGRLMERLATGQEQGRVILIVGNDELPRVQSQADVTAWDSPPALAARERGFGAYTIPAAQAVRKPTFVFTATSLAPVVRPTHVNLADQLSLIGYERKTDELTPGGTFTAHLYWTAIQPMPESYTGFMHLIGPDGKMVAQDDHELGRGFYRTMFWQPGEIMRERYELTLPANLTPGEYTVRAGAYRFPSLERLAVRSSDVAVQDNVLTVDVMQARQ